MRKLLFVHDGPIFYDKDGKYYEVAYHGLYERYQYLADEITFLMRTEPVTKSTKNTPVPDEIHVVSVPNFKHPALYFRKIGQVRKIIRNAVMHADILVLRGASCSTIALKYAKKMNKPYIYECVGCSWDSMWNYSLLGKLMAPYVFFRDREQVKKSPYVCYVTEKFLQQRYPTKGRSVACSNVVIDMVDKRILDKRIDRIGKYEKKQKYRIGTAAAIDVRYKGQEYVIRAVAELIREGYDFEYYLAGGNRLGSSFLKDLAKKWKISDRIHFVGSLDLSKMPEFYDSLDIYVQPSKQEGLPRAVIEAMSRGVPVIGTDIAGIPELLQKENLFKKGSIKAVKLALKRMVSSNMAKYASENYDKAKKYQINVITDRRNAFYDDFLQDLDFWEG